MGSTNPMPTGPSSSSSIWEKVERPWPFPSNLLSGSQFLPIPLEKRSNWVPGAPRLEENQPPAAPLRRYGDFAVVFKLLVWTRQVDSLARVRDEVLHRVWYEFFRIAIPLFLPPTVRQSFIVEQRSLPLELNGKSRKTPIAAFDFRGSFAGGKGSCCTPR